MFSDYEIMGKQKYLRIVADANERRNTFACNMISEVEIPGIVRLYFAPSGGKDIYKYNVTDYTRLDEFLDGFYTVDELAEIISGIFNTLGEIENYALSIDRIALSKYSIYVNKNTMDVKMIYIPVEGTFGDFSENLRYMLLDIMENAPFNDPRIGQFSRQLRNSDVLRLPALRNILATMFTPVNGRQMGCASGGELQPMMNKMNSAGVRGQLNVTNDKGVITNSEKLNNKNSMSEKKNRKEGKKENKKHEKKMKVEKKGKDTNELGYINIPVF